MKDNWKQISLGDLQKSGLADLQTGPFGTVLKASEYTDSGVPVISVGEIRKGFLRITENTPRVDKEITNRLPKYVLEQGDIVFGRKGAIDRNSIINDEQDGWFLGSDGIRLRLSAEVNSRFVSYQLRSNAIGKWLLQSSVGSTMPSLNQKILDRLPLRLPELVNQTQIAKILSDLDTKIELNNKINIKLEQMAKLIYGYWFVQFDFPNEQGIPYKSSGGKMVFNKELKREIPEGWESENLNSLLEFKKGVEPGSKAYTDRKVNDTFVKFFRVSNINGNSDTYIDSSKKVYNYAEEGDVVVTFDGSVGKVGIGLNGAYSSGLRKVYSSSKELKNSFIYLIFKDQRINKTIHKYSTGSIILHASKSIEHLLIPYKKNVCDEFQNITEPLYAKIVSNIKQNQQLSGLRDWLLPMLMNGQVRVGEVEKQLGMVAGDSVKYGEV